MSFSNKPGDKEYIAGALSRNAAMPCSMCAHPKNQHGKDGCDTAKTSGERCGCLHIRTVLRTDLEQPQVLDVPKPAQIGFCVLTSSGNLSTFPDGLSVKVWLDEIDAQTRAIGGSHRLQRVYVFHEDPRVQIDRLKQKNGDLEKRVASLLRRTKILRKGYIHEMTEATRWAMLNAVEKHRAKEATERLATAERERDAAKEELADMKDEVVNPTGRWVSKQLWYAVMGDRQNAHAKDVTAAIEKLAAKDRELSDYRKVNDETIEALMQRLDAKESELREARQQTEAAKCRHSDAMTDWIKERRLKEEAERRVGELRELLQEALPYVVSRLGGTHYRDPLAAKIREALKEKAREGVES